MAVPALKSKWWEGSSVENAVGYGFNDPSPDYATGRHPGIDVGLSYKPIRAGEAGTVTFAGWMEGTGNTVVVTTANGTRVLLGHLSEIHVRPGQGVLEGQRLGISGASGNASGPHLHFEVRNSTGQPVNPTEYLKRQGSRPGLPNFPGIDIFPKENPLGNPFEGIAGAIQNVANSIGGAAESATTNLVGFGATLGLLLLFGAIAIGLILVGTIIVGRNVQEG